MRVPALLRRGASAAATLIALGACANEVSSLPGAVGEIPIFNPAEYLDYSSAFTSDVISDPMKFSSYSWTLETERPASEVIAFYEAQWPEAGREDDAEEGTVTLRNPAFPEDENEPLGESLMVIIWTERQDGKAKFTIDQDVFRNKRR